MKQQQMRKIELILVDDHKMFLEGMTAVLSKEDSFKVVRVLDNAKDALQALKETIPDLLITDISMPEMNGLEFIKALKKTYPRLKILVVSMFEQIQAFDQIDGYLLKETSYEELVKAIKGIVLNNETHFYKAHKKTKTTLEFNKNIITSREKEIIKLIAKELTTNEIADKLFLSKRTVETHKKNIFFKLQVTNAAGLIKKAIYLGYVD